MLVKRTNYSKPDSIFLKLSNTMNNKECEDLEGMNVRKNQRSMLRTLPMQDNLHHGAETFFPAALYPPGDQINGVLENHVRSPGFGSGYDQVRPEQIHTSVFANPSWPSFVPDHAHYESPLESEFSALNLSENPHPAAFMAAPPDYRGAIYTGGDPVNFHREFDLPIGMGFSYTNLQIPNGSLQKLRAQSAANGNMGLFAHPQNYTVYKNLENSNPFSLNGHFNPSPVCDFNGVYNLPRNLNGNFRWNDFRLTENRNLYPNLERGSLVIMAAKDQHGCKQLQKKLLQGTHQEKNMILSGLMSHVLDLMVDQFGNYLIQTIFEVCSVEQMDQLLWFVTNDLISLFRVCLDIRGAKAMQTMLEHLKTPEQTARVLSELRRLTVLLSRSKIGQHVIHHCLQSFSPEENKHILNEVTAHCVDIATDQDGCRALKQCVFHAQGELQDRLVAEIAANSVFLAQHAYGNYVVQYLLELGVPHVTAAVLDHLSGNFVALSLNKYGSHVVENCMKTSEGDHMIEIINEIISSPKLLTVLQNPYGNFVAQSALKFSKGTFLHKNMIALILEHYPFLQSHPHGQRVLTKVKGSKNLGDHVKNSC